MKTSKKKPGSKAVPKPKGCANCGKTMKKGY